MKKLKIVGIVLAALIVLGAIGSLFGGGDEKKDENAEDSTKTEETTSSETTEEEEVEETKEVITLTAGEVGEYGKEITMNEGTDMPEDLIVYYLPAGDYTVTNVSQYPTQVSVYGGFERDETTGYDNYTEVGDTPRLEVNESVDINVPEGWFIEIHEPTIIELVKK